ncbi:hypothetical protein LR48_Vigan11g048900 [Vigna angularis]|uniref:Uncharacterized protein n=1 Tax=Phaseolus angularis TaxID=3914 RepID=A0A0L9VQX9_PHAAN|nr:hypothetical protein LR48_Vigan11g048900 [Vigna angularis]
MVLLSHHITSPLLQSASVASTLLSHASSFLSRIASPHFPFICTSHFYSQNHTPSRPLPITASRDSISRFNPNLHLKSFEPINRFILSLLTILGFLRVQFEFSLFSRVRFHSAASSLVEEASRSPNRARTVSIVIFLGARPSNSLSSCSIIKIIYLQIYQCSSLVTRWWRSLFSHEP